ncbi:MAG: hypothetical protein WBW16_11400 [Bacteroidota bacterium]
MNKKPFKGIPAPFHAAVVFAVFFSLLGSPAPRNNSNLGVLRGIVARIQAIFYDDSRDVKSGDHIKKGGRGVCELGGDGTTDPPPPPPPPPR